MKINSERGNPEEQDPEVKVTDRELSPKCDASGTSPHRQK